MTHQPPQSYVAHDGQSYAWPPPNGWWLASDGRYYPPERHPNNQPPPAPTATLQSSEPPVGGDGGAADWGPPAGAPPTPWYRRKLVWIAGGVVLLVAIVSSAAGTDEEESPVESAAADEGADAAVGQPFQPVAEAEEGADGPFWMTTFGLVIPSPHWEAFDFDGEALCRPVDESGWQLTNDRGVQVAPFDSAALLTFDRSSSEISGETCTVRVGTMGDFNDDLGDSYTVGNGQVSATFTPEELFSGQDGGPDSVKAAS